MMSLKIMFTLFALHMSHKRSNKTWNQMEINYNLVKLFAMQHIKILDGINSFSMSIHVKEKMLDCVNEESCYSKY